MPSRITFDSLNLIEPLARAVAEEGYVEPTPIQAQAIPLLLSGRDVLGCAQTGTGKTAAFALPVLQRLASGAQPSSGRRHIRALVLSPTRELIAQIGDNFEAYSRHLSLRSQVIFGGVNATPQIQELRRGIDILLATPGRLLDLENQGYLDLSHVEFFVLDEADRMLDMGFIHDIRKVLKKLPPKKQNLLFSATMPPHIVELAGEFLVNPAQVEVVPESTTAERVQQQVMFVERNDKRRLLAHLLSRPDVEQSIVFTRTKHGANRLVEQLEREGHQAAAIHGNKSQNARTRALNAFREGTLPTLIATDIAARGIDVPGVSHVFNFDLPNEPESYVHRIGRTGRAGESGLAIALCDSTEGVYLRQIERLIGEELEVITAHEWHCPSAIPPPAQRRGGRREEHTQSEQQGQRNQRNSDRAPGKQKRRSGQRSSRDGERSNESLPSERTSEVARSEVSGSRRDDGQRPSNRRGGRGSRAPSTSGEQPQQPRASSQGAEHKRSHSRPEASTSERPRRRKRRGGGPRDGSSGTSNPER